MNENINNNNLLTRREALKSIFSMASLPVVMNLDGKLLQQTSENPLANYIWEGEGSQQFYSIIRDQNGYKVWDRVFNTMVYHPELGSINENGEVVVEGFETGSEKILVDIDKYGILLMLAHSGYNGQDSQGNQLVLEAEGIRERIEGTLMQEASLDSLTEDRLAEIELFVHENIEELIGLEFQMNQGHPVFADNTYEIAAISHIPNSEVERFSQDSKQVLDISKDNDALRADEWELAKMNPSQYIMLTFCGHGPYELENWGTYSRYNVLLRFKQDNIQES